MGLIDLLTSSAPLWLVIALVILGYVLQKIFEKKLDIINAEKTEELKNESNRLFRIYEKKKETIEKIMYSYYECIDHVDSNFDTAASRYALISEDSIRGFEKELASNFLFMDEFSWRCTKFAISLLRNNSDRLANKNPVAKKHFSVHDFIAINYLYAELQKYFRKKLDLSAEDPNLQKVLAICLYAECSAINKYCDLRSIVRLDYCEASIDGLIKKVGASAREVKLDIDAIIFSIERSESQILLLSLENYKYIKELAIKAL